MDVKVAQTLPDTISGPVPRKIFEISSESNWTELKISEIEVFFLDIESVYFDMSVKEGNNQVIRIKLDPCFESWITFGNTKIRIFKILRDFQLVRNLSTQVEHFFPKNFKCDFKLGRDGFSSVSNHIGGALEQSVV